MMSWKSPLIPFPIIACVVIGLVAHLLLMESSYGAVLRGAGGNATAIDRAGWSLLKIRMLMYALAGFFGVLSGLSLIGLTTSPDAHIADRYTLLSIAGVILGGGEFVGGRVSPIGAVIGAVTLTLTGSFLIFMRISPDWQIGAQGARPDRRARPARAHQAAGGEMKAIAARLGNQPWLLSFLGALAVWLATILFTEGKGGGEVITAALVLLHLHGDRRHRPDVRHHHRPRQCRSLDPVHHRARRRRRDEDHGRRGRPDLARPAGLHRLRPRGRRLQLRADPHPADPAHHRDPVVEPDRHVGRDLLWPRAADQAAAQLRRFHHRADRRHSAARRSARSCSRS